MEKITLDIMNIDPLERVYDENYLMGKCLKSNTKKYHLFKAGDKNASALCGLKTIFKCEKYYKPCNYEFCKTCKKIKDVIIWIED